jgi:methionyl-tRNA formyltransferase
VLTAPEFAALPEPLARLVDTVVEVPPLRHRADDVLPLAHAEARAARRRPVEFSARAARALAGYWWPENVRQLRRVVRALANGEDLPATPQDPALATYAPKIAAEDRVIDWSAPATDVVNRIRALAPHPGATTTFRGSPLKLFRARTDDATGPPGEIVRADAEGFEVAVADAAVRVLDVGPAGRTRMPASAFVNGFRPIVGERLG